MDEDYLKSLYNLEGKTAVITGGGGVLCRVMSLALARLGVKVAVLDISVEAAQRVAAEIQAQGGQTTAVRCDVLDKASVEGALQAVLQAYNRVDILINGAGGNKKQATTAPDLSFFDLPADAIQGVFNLNFIGTLLPSQVFGKEMVRQGDGVILNISSMNAFRPLTRIAAYSAAKAAISNFTQWLAVYMAQNHSADIRVNAIAPGFFLTDQNRFLLTDERTGELTPRGRQIIAGTPMGRFGQPADLVGTLVWLLSDASRFLTGVVVPVDGGFNAYSGV
jgi:NAD(P)-dependent dehydrogenase (short-subunit alcohol dehydrogenase family)